MSLPHRDTADMPAVVVAALQRNREADPNDLDSNQLVEPVGSPTPLDSPFGSAISSMSGFPDTTEDLFSFWGTDCALEGPYDGLNFEFPCPLQLDFALDMASSLGLWALDAELAGPAHAAILSQAPNMVPETTIGLSASVPSTFCHPVSGDPVGGPSTVAGSAISASPPTPTATTPSTPASDDILDDGSPTSLVTLRRILRQRYPDRKPPGPLFKNFISRRGRWHNCTLCEYRIQNREQMNQHLMKAHCAHRPFACPVPGCGHRDARRADSIKHQEKHGAAKWGCKHCGQLVQNERNLRRHIQNKHPEVYQPLGPRRKYSRRAI